jgi:hypothetical protein
LEKNILILFDPNGHVQPRCLLGRVAVIKCRKVFDVNTEVEEEIKVGLKGDERKQYEAVCKAYDRFADPLASFIRESVAPTLDEHELTTAVNNVFLDLAKKAKKGGFTSGGSLKSLLFTMAKYKALAGTMQ